MRKLVRNIGLVLAIIYIVPFIVYGIGSVLVGLKPPEGASPARFLVSVLVSKVGAATAFVLIFYVAREELSRHWFLYASLWWVMFVIGEIGQTISLQYSWKEAVAGMISETIYWPLSALVTNRLIGVRQATTSAAPSSAPTGDA